MQQYNIYHQIGAGAFGDVFYGTHKATGTSVAIKRIHIPTAATELPSTFIHQQVDRDNADADADGVDQTHTHTTHLKPFKCEGLPKSVVREWQALQLIAADFHTELFEEDHVHDDDDEAAERFHRTDEDDKNKDAIAVAPFKTFRTALHLLFLYDAFIYQSNLVLITDYFLIDLYRFQWYFIQQGERIPLPVIKCILYQILTGLARLHELNICHRDLKASNIFMDENGYVVLGDFGQSRRIPSSALTLKTTTASNEGNDPDDIEFSSRKLVLNDPNSLASQLSTDITTRWYRAPEILHGSQYYDVSIDCWACGVVTADLFRNAPLFNGETDISQLHAIHSLLGTPTLDTWPELATFSDYNKIQYLDVPARPWKDVLPPDCDDVTIDFISSFCCYRSKQRMSAKEALRHPFFATLPHACHPIQLANLVKIASASISQNNQNQVPPRSRSLPQTDKPSPKVLATDFIVPPCFSAKKYFMRNPTSSSTSERASSISNEAYDACIDLQTVTNQSIARLQNWNDIRSRIGIP